MKVNDSQYVHSTTLTLDISEVFFSAKKVHAWACGETVVLFWCNHHNLQYQPNSSSAFRFFFFTTSQCSYRSSCLLPLSAPRTLLLCILPFYFLVSHAATQLCACFPCLCVHSKVSSIVILNSDGLVLHGAEIFCFRMVCSVRSRFLCTHLWLCAFDSDVCSDAQSLNTGLIVSAIII